MAKGSIVERGKIGQGCALLNPKLTIQYYRRLLREHGPGPRALGYNRDNQAIRFGQVHKFFDLQESEVLDVGCGYGSFYGYLRDSDVKVRSYLGIDLVKDFIDEADKTYGSPSARFELTDFFSLPNEEICDYSVAFGTFCSRTGGDGDAMLEAATRKMFSLSRRGIVITLNSSTADKRNDSTVYTDPSFALDLALSLSRNVSLIHSTFPFEFALAIGKRQSFDQATLAFSDHMDGEFH